MLECKPLDSLPPALQQQQQQGGSRTHLVASTPEWGSLSVAAPVMSSGGGGGDLLPPPATADVTLPDGTVLRLPVHQQYVLNPLTNQPYEVQWGADKLTGAPVVLSCTLYEEPAVHGGSPAPGVPASSFNVEQGGGSPLMGGGAAAVAAASPSAEWGQSQSPPSLPGALSPSGSEGGGQ